MENKIKNVLKEMVGEYCSFSKRTFSPDNNDQDQTVYIPSKHCPYFLVKQEQNTSVSSSHINPFPNDKF